MLKRYAGVYKNHTIMCAVGNVVFVDGKFETDNPLQQSAIESDPLFGVKFNVVAETDEDELPAKKGRVK